MEVSERESASAVARRSFESEDVGEERGETKDSELKGEAQGMERGMGAGGGVGTHNVTPRQAKKRR